MTLSERLKRLELVTSEERGTSPHALAEKAGLPASTIRNMLKKLRTGVDPNPKRATMEAIARAAGVSRAWLDGDPVPMTPHAAEYDSPTPPPVSGPRVVVAELLNKAFSHSRHEASDAALVSSLLAGSVQQLSAVADPVVYVRELLDVAARERLAGRQPRPSVLPLLAVEHLAAQLREREQTPAPTPRRPASQR